MSMKVLHLGKFDPYFNGGVEKFTGDLLEFLNDTGIQADLLCFGRSSKVFYHQNFKVFEAKTVIDINSMPLSLKYYAYFRQLVDNYDIIHIHSPNPFAELITLFSNLRKKIIIHWHSDIVRQKISYQFYKYIQRRILKKAAAIVVTSPEYFKTSKQLNLGFTEGKVRIIPLAINPKRLEGNICKFELGTIKNKIKNKRIVLSVGRLVEYKGFRFLIQAAKYLKENILILIIGNGPLYDNLYKQIKEENLQNRVALLKNVANISHFIRSCDVFCLPSISRNEAFGLVLIEALYFGKPLITTSVKGSGMNYININNQTGLVVDPKNPQALAHAIDKVISNKKLYNFFSENAKKRFEEFRIDYIGTKIIDLYKEILTI